MTVKVNSLNIFYEKTGNGRPLILLHGNGESHKIFDKALPVLRRYFTVYALDTRGHGKSGGAEFLHYSDMAEDVRCFIEALELEKPVLYGFSDGGIVGLIIASRYPKILSQLIISGANTVPSGIKSFWLKIFRLIYFITKDSKMKLMLMEPDITKKDLEKITVPTAVFAGSRDIIKKEHTEYIAKSIKNSTLAILPGENHESYVVHSPKIAKLIIKSTAEEKA